jgi:hypothetical protein
MQELLGVQEFKRGDIAARDGRRQIGSLIDERIRSAAFPSLLNS